MCNFLTTRSFFNSLEMMDYLVLLFHIEWVKAEKCKIVTILKGNSGIFKPRPYFWHEIRSSTHREQFGESRLLG